jgi:hypothetical protein
MADGIPGYRGSTVTTSAGKSFMSTVLARMPFSVAIIDNISQLNPKYEVFQDLSQDRESRVNQQSVFRTDTENELGMGSVMIDKNYSQFMYANLDLDKVKRIADYRKMAGYNVMADCLDEIADELLVEDEVGTYCKLNLKGDYSKAIEEEVQKEWKKFVDVFEFKERGWERFRQFIIDGELFFENVISEEHPEYGIIGIVEIPTQLINPFYKNVQNDVLDGFALRKPAINKRTEKMEKEELIIFQRNQVTYIHSGSWNEDRSIKLPYIENARRAYKQLSLIEDSIIIYRLVRAPERLVFHVDVGNMSPPKAESYIKRLMQQYWSKKTYDTTTGRITNVYDPQSMLDSYFFPRRAGTEGTKVEQLAGGANLGTLDDLLYFQRLLYKNMKVPTSRLNPEDGYKDGKESSREEIRFGKYLKRIQLRFAHGLKDSFITHLKLRKIWDNYKIKERSLDIIFNISSSFDAFRQQQFFDLKYNNFNNMCANESISPSFAQKKYLGLSDEEMALNREWKRRDAAFQYELEMLLSQGPAWKQQYQATQAAAAEMGATAGGGPASSGGGAPSTPPDFGPAPDAGAPAPAGGGTPAPAGGAPAPAGGAPAPAPAGGAQA